MKNILSIFASMLIFVSCCTQKNNAATTVYVTETGNKYHISACRYLSKSCIPISLSDAVARKYEPCSDCIPPALQTLQSENKEEVSPEVKAANTTSVKAEQNTPCSGITKKGNRCKRKVKHAGDKCFQHKDK